MRERKKRKIIRYRKKRSYSVRRDGSDRRSLTYMRCETLRSASNTVQRLSNTCQTANTACFGKVISESPLTICRRERTGMQVSDYTALLCVPSAWILSCGNRPVFKTDIYGSERLFLRSTFKQLCLHGTTESSIVVCNVFISRRSQVLISAKKLFPDWEF
jgi:hypothetical protein